MPKHERSRCIACVSYFKSCPDNCEFKNFFPNDSEIDYTNFFKVVKSASSLRALLNETVDGRVKTDVEKLTQIRSILIEGNISRRYPVQRAACKIYMLHKRIESLELQLPEKSKTSKMAPLSFSAATVTRDPLYNVDSFML
ncbi:hypothetical protein WN944_000396 [Citrus x changshan-huyou]|uniref:LOB domain-containing protein n=1 Tax=Citrus x changshan-huyou TaxID=2935761 RepID=A0AAP0MEG4_9ROSI